MRETGKIRAQRIQLDYHRRSDGVKVLRRVAIWIALLLTTLYGTYALLGAGKSQLNTGPLSRAHAPYEHACAKCHGADFGVSIASDAWHPWPKLSLAKMEALCQECHHADGHFRSRLQNVALDQDCSSCHHEHLGRDYQPGVVADRNCTQCHRDLTQAVAAGSPPVVRTQVQSFTLASHGEFRSLSKDIGKVYFDHAQHLRPGQVDAGSRGGFQLYMLEAPWRRFYRKPDQTDDQSPVQLACADCHQPFGTENSQTANAHHAQTGVGYAPIQFEEHCGGCHAMNYTGRTAEQLPLPHAAPWTEMRALLQAKVASNRLDGLIQAPHDQAQGDASREKVAPPSSKETAPQGSKAGVDLGLEFVRQRCLKCHAEGDVTGEAIAHRDEHNYIQASWFTHGFFNHAAHTAIDCISCHPGTQAPLPNEESTAARQPQPPQDHQLVMIRGIESCTPCHRPESQPAPESLRSGDEIALLKSQPLRASDSCIECHRYHWTRTGSAVAGGTAEQSP